MEWSTLLGTALGATAGLGAAVLSERARWSLGRNDRKRDVLKTSYIGFLTNVTKAGEQVWHAAREHGPGWKDSILTALRDNDVNAARFSLSLEAPTGVRKCADELIAAFVAWRDIAHAGSRKGDEAFDQAWQKFGASRNALVDAMRLTLEPVA
ncbi:MAG TPA: hypothetical protein VFA06_22490 [Actinocrinis sp.]|jgi:hypothetical protein|uniref:hypothetical protein n=1 Tax=Actinocrinis sp. TaxID=1920516 RepID=UPI002D2DA1EA|nr:hypothetical protein [Actinocrinis sp.]HZU58664.1 hypothetical protein [Actinocrinis sp.]